MPFELIESLLTGVAEIDEDHRDLIARVNGIAEAERAADVRTLRDRLTEFKAHLLEHFRNEEAFLREMEYPKADAHARHHAEIIVALKRLAQGVRDGAPVPQIADACFDELVSTILLRDMQFLNWLADHQMRARR